MQGGEGPLAGFGKGDKATLLANAQRGETESGCRNAGNDSVIGSTYVSPIFDKASFRISLFPKIREINLLQRV